LVAGMFEQEWLSIYEPFICYSREYTEINDSGTITIGIDISTARETSEIF